MFQQAPSIILTTALLSIHTHTATASHGCYPTYTPNTSYTLNDTVSATKTKTSTAYETCTGTDNGCNGTYRSVTTTTSTVNNYKCTNSVWCSQGTYDPAGLFGGSAWSLMEEEECDPVSGRVVVLLC